MSGLRKVSHAMRRLRLFSTRLATALAAIIGVDELGLLMALGLVGVGCWHVWRPAGAALVCGLVLLWIFVPQRSALMMNDPRRKVDGKGV